MYTEFPLVSWPSPLTLNVDLKAGWCFQCSFPSLKENFTYCAQQKTKRIYQLLWKNEPQRPAFSEEGRECCHKNSITPRYSCSNSHRNCIVQIILCANGFQESRKCSCLCQYHLFTVFKLPKCVRKLNLPSCSLILHLEIQSHNFVCTSNTRAWFIDFNIL